MDKLKTITVGLLLAALSVCCCIADVNADYSGYNNHFENAQSPGFGGNTLSSVDAESTLFDAQESAELVFVAPTKANFFSSKVQLYPDLELNSSQLPPDRVKAFDVQYRMLEPEKPWYLSNSISGKYRLGGWKNSHFYYQSDLIFS